MASDQGSVSNLIEALAYQDGAVVSKTLIKRETGTVTLFAFAAGEGLSEHTSPYEAMVLVLDGLAEIRISGQPHQLRSGEMLLLPAGEPHALKAIENFKMLLVMIKS